MPIVIQDLLASDTLSQAVDKINFNFDQLILNGGGPSGPSGPAGPTGPVGGRGIKGATWYKDSAVSPGTDPNNLIILGINDDDYFLQSNGQVWQYNGTVWVQSVVNLIGPQGLPGSSSGFSYAGGFPGGASINNQNAAYLSPMPDGLSGGANQITNEGVSAVLFGAIASNAIPPTGITFTSAFKLPDVMTKSLDSSVLTMLIHQKDSASSAIRFMGGGVSPIDKYEQAVLTNLSNITLGVDDSFDINVPKASTAPISLSDLIGFNLNTLKRGQQFYSGKQITFIVGADATPSGLPGEISDVSYTINTTNTSIPAKFSVATTFASASSLFEIGGNITIPASTSRTGSALIEAGQISLIGNEIRLNRNTSQKVVLDLNSLTSEHSLSIINQVVGTPSARILIGSAAGIVPPPTTSGQNGNILIDANATRMIGNTQIWIGRSTAQYIEQTPTLGTQIVDTLQGVKITGKAYLTTTPTTGAVSTSQLLARNTVNDEIVVLPASSILPIGVIMMWSSATLPTGWYLCNGQTVDHPVAGSITTPDLRERFIVGADIVLEPSDRKNYDQFVYTHRTANGTSTGSVPLTNGLEYNFVISSEQPLYIGITGQLATGSFYGDSYVMAPYVYTCTSVNAFMAFDRRIMEYRLFAGVPTISSYYGNNYFDFNVAGTDSVGTYAEYTKWNPNGIRFNLPTNIGNNGVVTWPYLNRYFPGETGGQNEVKIAQSQIGPHDHLLISSETGGSDFKGSITNAERTHTFISPNNERNYNDEYDLYGVPTLADRGVSKYSGGFQPVENRPPYYALAFIMYIGV